MVVQIEWSKKLGLRISHIFLPLFRHFLEHHNKWTHSRKHINMAFQNRFYFLDISSSCWEIVVYALVEVGWLWIIWPLSVTHWKWLSHIWQFLSSRSGIQEVKPVLKTILIGFLESFNLLGCSKKYMNHCFLSMKKR